MIEQTNKTTLQKAFELFYTTHILRPVMCAPFVVDDYTYATDSYTLIRCKSELIDFDFENKHEPLNLEGIINPENTNEPIPINNFDWETYKNTNEMIDSGEDVECGHCNAQGICDDTVYYKSKIYDIEYECPVCHGSGYEEETKQIPTGEKTFQPTALIALKDSKFYANKFYRLKQVSDLFNLPVVLIYYIAKNKASMFRIGNLEILIMPCSIDNNDDVIATFL